MRAEARGGEISGLILRIDVEVSVCVDEAHPIIVTTIRILAGGLVISADRTAKLSAVSVGPGVVRCAVSGLNFHFSFHTGEHHTQNKNDVNMKKDIDNQIESARMTGVWKLKTQ